MLPVRNLPRYIKAESFLLRGITLAVFDVICITSYSQNVRFLSKIYFKKLKKENKKIKHNTSILFNILMTNKLV